MRKERISEVVITYIILILVSFIFFFPVLWLVMASFSATGSIYDYDGFFQRALVQEPIISFLMILQCMIIRHGLGILFCFCLLMHTFYSACDTYCLYHEQIQIQNEKASYEDNSGT
ncbi:hypothetical protein [Butyrivibrio fibrisolvens]|uniref:hypothetical protein n=1 Tax=Butyrivibrio fibrisolvens TaxID=831 RepID=UPI0020BF26CD|nr:hypothetical protein [Butyrivibrio fibrisolvens]